MCKALGLGQYDYMDKLTSSTSHVLCGNFSVLSALSKHPAVVLAVMEESRGSRNPLKLEKWIYFSERRFQIKLKLPTDFYFVFL